MCIRDSSKTEFEAGCPTDPGAAAGPVARPGLKPGFWLASKRRWGLFVCYGSTGQRIRTARDVARRPLHGTPHMRHRL
eukprot:4716257-Prymnesium_polylepis.1